jgi:RNA polymerase sigma factor (sigma-70 family)
MVRTTLASVLRQLSLASSRGPARELDDTRLLERFCQRGEESAFTLLVVRHGPMVLGVCRRLLGDGPDAEDAFQATFVVLLRRARLARRVGSLAGWLHGVAWRVASRARARRSVLRPLPEVPSAGDSPSDAAARREEAMFVDEEINRLPERYRVPVVLCALRGLSYEEAGRELGWPKSTVAHRLDRARQTLRRRLGKRGVAAPAALVALAGAGRANVPAGLTLDTVRLAMRTPTGEAGMSPAFKLADGMTRGLASARWAAVLLATAAAVGLTASLAGSGAVREPTNPPAQKRAESPAVADAPRRTDADGLPLPEGAVARVGSNRLRHGQHVNNLTLSPDGRLLASSGGGRLRLWDAATGKLLRHVACPGQKYTQDGCFSADGKTILALDGNVCRWFDVSSAKEVRHLDVDLQEKKGLRRAVALAPTGDRLALYDGSDLIVYDLLSGAERQRWTLDLDLGGNPTFSRDGTMLSAMEADRKRRKDVLRLFDIRTGDTLGRFDLPDYVGRFCFSPDGKLLAGCSQSRETFVWKLPGGELLHRVKSGVPSTTIAFAPDSRTLAYSSPDQDVVLFDTAAGKELRHLPAHWTVHCVFSVDGSTLSTSNGANVISQWDCATGRRLDASASPAAGYQRLRFSEDGQRLLGWAGELLELDWRTGKEIRRFSDPVGGGWNFFVAVSRDGTRLVRAKPSVELGVWDTGTGKQLLALNPGNLGASYMNWASPSFSPDGHRLYGGRQNGVLQAWDVDGGAEHKPTTKDVPYPYIAEVSPDGRRLAVARNEGAPPSECASQVVVLDLPTGREVLRFRPAPGAVGQDKLLSLVFSPDGNLVAGAGGVYGPRATGQTIPGTGLVMAVDIRTGRHLVLQPKLSRWLSAAAFSPDSRVLATGGDDGLVRLWEVASGKQRGAFVAKDDVGAVAFSPDGRLLASGGEGPALVWDVDGRALHAASAEPFTAGDKDRLWQALAGDDAEAAYAAIRQLLARPTPAVDLLASRLRPALAVAPERLRGLLRDLEADDFNARERATVELERVADVVEQPVRAALNNAKSAESKKRLERVLDAVDAPVPEQLRQVRAVEVLERIGTPDALRVLNQLAGGAPGARLTREAQSSLQRGR